MLHHVPMKQQQLWIPSLNPFEIKKMGNFSVNRVQARIEVKSAVIAILMSWKSKVKIDAEIIEVEVDRDASQRFTGLDF